MTIGEKIKKFRTAQNLSQKQLALRSGMSEPAIRNYELGNRNPSDKQLEKIASALDVSIFALSNPDLESYDGIMHALFYLEDEYGLEVKEKDGELCLFFKGNNNTASSGLSLWNRVMNEFKSGKMSKEDYDLWRYSYPRLEAERIRKRLNNHLIKNKKSDDN